MRRTNKHVTLETAKLLGCAFAFESGTHVYVIYPTDQGLEVRSKDTRRPEFEWNQHNPADTEQWLRYLEGSDFLNEILLVELGDEDH